MANRIDKDIETTADVYPPSTYQQLLTNFHDLALATDSAGRGPDGFIPLTQARSNRTGRSSIPFVIGVIPPSVEITGRLLDRSATVIQLEDGQSSGATSNSGDDAAGLNQGGPGPAGRNIGAHRAARQTCIDAFTKEMGREPTTAELQYLQAVAFLETTYGNGWKGEMVGSNNWGAVHCTPKQEKDDTFFGLLRGNTGVNIGGTRISAGRCISYTDTHSDGSKYSQTFRSYATPEDGARDVVKNIFKQRGVSKALESGSIYDASLEMRRGHYYSGWCPEATKKYGAKVARESEQTPDKNEGTLACEREAVTTHAEKVQGVINDIAVSNGDTSKPPLGTFDSALSKYQQKQQEKAKTKDGAVQGDGGQNAGWQDQGADAASRAAKARAKTAGTSLNESVAGQRLQAAQNAYLNDLWRKVEAMKAVPPLKMLVNPSSFSVKGEKIVQDGSWGRNGPIIEHWGDNQDSISASGKLAGFFAIDRKNAGGPGLTRYARNYSVAWQNFQSLFLFYKNNAAIYTEDPFGNGASNMAMLGSIYIYYDNILYIGSFTSLSITEDASKPFSADYNFEFQVRACFVLDRQDDEFTYGAPGLFPGNVPVSNVGDVVTNATPSANVGGQEVTPTDLFNTTD